MNERTALILAGLSHGLFILLLPLPIIFGIAAHYTGVLQKRTLDSGSPVVKRIVGAMRLASCGLLAICVTLLGVGFTHIGCAYLVAHR